jgi:hypothetical protein
MERSGTVNGCNADQTGTHRNLRAGTQYRIGTNSGKRSRSRFKNERNTVKNLRIYIKEFFLFCSRFVSFTLALCNRFVIVTLLERYFSLVLGT